MKHFLFAITLLFTTTAFSQQTFKYPDAKIKFTIPTGWKVTSENNEVTATNADGDFVVVFNLLSEADIDDGTDEELSNVLDEEFDNVQIAVADQMEKHNGMDVLMFAGSLTDSEQNQFELMGALVETPSKHVLAITMMGDEASIQENDEELESMLNSIKPLK